MVDGPVKPMISVSKEHLSVPTFMLLAQTLENDC